MKRLFSIFLIAAFAACSQFDKPEYTTEQLNVLSESMRKPFTGMIPSAYYLE